MLHFTFIYVSENIIAQNNCGNSDIMYLWVKLHAVYFYVVHNKIPPMTKTLQQVTLYP